MNDRRQARDRVQVLLLLVVAAVILTVSASWTWTSLVDDAYISLRYADQLAHGNGIAYNATTPAVEGVTNLAWTATLALGLLVGLPPVPLLTGLGWIFALLTLAGVTALTRALSGRSDAIVAVPALLLAVLPHTAIVATNGLETTMMAAAVVWTLAAWAGPGSRRRAGLFAAALLWVRPEGLLVVGLLGLAELWRHRDDRRVAWQFLLPPIASQLVQTIWRLWTYGDILPNTYRAKASFPITETFRVNATYFTPEQVPLVAITLAFVIAAFAPPRQLERRVVIGAGLILALAPLTVQEWMPGLRLFHPAIAVTVCLVGSALAALPRSLALVGAVPVLAAVVGLAMESGTRARAYDARHSVEPDNGAALAAAYLNEHLPDGAWLATRDAGVLAYYIGHHVDVAELHQRALTLPHPDGKDADIRLHTPKNPEVFIATVRTAEQPGFEYGNDRQVFQRFSEPYLYLGRVYQHIRRHYDIYVRADLGIEALPDGIVVSRAGPAPKAGATEQADAEPETTAEEAP